MRNGYHTGHADVSCVYFLIDAFMLQWGGLAPGTCAQRGPFSSRRWRFFSHARHVDAPQISEALQTPTNSSTELPTVHTLDKHSAWPCHFLLSKHKQVLSCINKYWVTERVCARPQLARYSVNTKTVLGYVSPRSVSHTARSNINLA